MKCISKLLKLITLMIIILLITFIIDIILVYTLDFYPIYKRKVISANNFTTYNSLGYRIFECNGKRYKDLFYKKSDYCEYTNLKEKDINTFSSEIVSSFDKYKNKFIVLNGKVSYKKGNNYIELKSYNDDTNKDINGNVIFNENIVYKFKFNNLNNINNLKVYDNVKIVGRISKIIKNKDIYTIIIKDAYIPDIKLYNNYKINVVEDKNCQKDKTNYVSTKDNNFYTSCLKNVYVVFEKEVYELNYVLKDEKFTLKNLITGYKEIEEKEVENYINKLYSFKEYKILVCGNNNNVIIGNNKLNLENNYCESSTVDNNEL